MTKIKKLTKIEALELENYFLETEIIKRDLDIEILKDLGLGLREEIKKYQINEIRLDRSSIKAHQKTLKEKKENLSSQREVVLTKIKKRLGLKGAFGFNPDTLEVTLNDDKGVKHGE